MRILVTGVAGFLGSHLADAFINNGHQVVGMDNLFGGELINVPAEVEFFSWDMTDQDVDYYASLMHGCDIVYHCAASPHEGVSSFAPGFICDNIFAGSVNTFSAAIKAGVKKIVYCSSMARYGNGHNECLLTPFYEWIDPKPVDPYGISKEAAERVLINLSQTHGFDYSIAVPHNIYGPRQKYDDPYRNVASIMANLMLQGRQPIIYGDGKQTRCFSYVSDAVDCLVKMALDDVTNGEIINIGPDEEFTTINELAQELATIIGFTNLKPIYMPDRPREVKHATCSSDKARELLGYNTKVSLRSGLTELVNWIKSNGVKPFNYHFDLEIINDKTPQTWKDRIF